MNGFAGKYKRSAALWVLLGAVLIFALPLPAGAQDMMAAEDVFVSVRHYEGVDPANHEAIIAHSAGGFLPITRGSEGFVGYFVLSREASLTAISIFETAEQASASNEATRDFVAENMAELLPEAPIIYEGPTGLHIPAALQGMDETMMMDGMPSLYASLRVYAGFDLTHFDEANALAESILVPDLLGIDGFFAQYTIHDEQDNVVAISIYESAAAAAAANERAVAFSREQLSQWVSGPPTGFDATVRVAALASVNMGENLIQDPMAEGAFVSIRVYDGVNPADQDTIASLVNESLVPIFRESDGFVGYYLLPADDMLAAISLYDSAEQAAASNDQARDFVAENLAPLLPNAPMILQGATEVMYVADAMTMDGDMGALYASLRMYRADVEQDPEVVERSNQLVKTLLLPALQEAGGLLSYYSLVAGDDMGVGLNVYKSEESALASNDIVAAFVAEHMMDLLPEDPLRLNGRLSAAAVAGN